MEVGIVDYLLSLGRNSGSPKFCHHDRSQEVAETQTFSLDAQTGRARFSKNFLINVDYFTSVADPDPGSGAFLTPRSGIRNRFFSGFRIPYPYF
jgi:hypothetical protein